MIQIYSPGNTNYSKNGDMVIFPTSCYADSRLKGEWKLELSHPLDEEERWKYIVENAVVSVPTSLGKNQLYRITYVEKTDTGVDAEAIPVFFDAANEIFLMDTRPTNKNGQEALNIMLTGHTDKYSATSDISEKNTAYFVRKNFIEALNNEDEDEAFINRWGGEPIYYNYQLIMNERAGSDRGVYILYGKNIESISETIDIGELVTRIVPVSSDGYILEGSTPWVDSPLIGSYPIIFTKEYKYDSIRLKDSSSEDEEGSGQDGSAEDGEYPDLPSLRAALLAAAEAEFATGIDKPKVNLKINMIDLTRTDMYKDYSVLETVHLGDTVHCKHSVLGIVTDARVIDIRWDCIRDCIDTVEVGEVNYDYFSAVNTAINSIPKVPDVFDEHGGIMAKYIKGVIDLAKTRLEYQKNNAKRSDVRAILYEDTAETLADGTPNPQYGALCIGTAGIQIAHEKDIYGEWIWGTAIDFQSVQADHIITGILADKTGTNYWNLDTGEFRLSTLAEVMDDTTLAAYVKAQSEAAAQAAAEGLDANLTQEVIFNKLTHNGVAQGIFMKDGQLYINMSYLSTGMMKLGGTNNQYGSIAIYDEYGNYSGFINCTGIDLGYGWFKNLYIRGENDTDPIELTTFLSGDITVGCIGGRDDDALQIYIRFLESKRAEIEELSAITSFLVYDGAHGSDQPVQYNPIMEKRVRSDAKYTKTIWIDDSQIRRLSFKPWGEEDNTSDTAKWYRPVASYGDSKNRVKYIASHSDSHTVPNSVGINGQFGSDTSYSTKNFAPSSSDIRLKEHIEDCDISALPFIEAIKMRQFDWKRNGVHQDCGFVADELEQIDPNLSIGGGYDQDGSMNEKSVNDFYLLGYLTKAVQELSQKVKDLEAKLENSPG